MAGSDTYFVIRGEILAAGDAKKKCPSRVSSEYVPMMLPVPSSVEGDDGIPDHLGNQNEVARILADSTDADTPSGISAVRDVDTGEDVFAFANTGLRARMADGSLHKHDHACWKISNADGFFEALSHFVPEDDKTDAMRASLAIIAEALARIGENMMVPNSFVSVIRAADIDGKMLVIGIGGYRSVAFRADRMETSPRVGAAIAFTSLSYTNAKGKAVRRVAIYRASTAANPIVHGHVKGKKLHESHVTDTFAITRAWSTADGKWPADGVIQARHHAGDGVSLHFKYTGTVNAVVRGYLRKFEEAEESSSSSSDDESSSDEE